MTYDVTPTFTEDWVLEETVICHYCLESSDLTTIIGTVATFLASSSRSSLLKIWPINLSSATTQALPQWCSVPFPVCIVLTVQHSLEERNWLFHEPTQCQPPWLSGIRVTTQILAWSGCGHQIRLHNLIPCTTTIHQLPELLINNTTRRSGKHKSNRGQSATIVAYGHVAQVACLEKECKMDTHTC